MTIMSPVLVLNASFEPISICATRRAITLLIKGAAQLAESHDQLIRPNLKWPSVIRLSNYTKIPARKHVVNRRGILTRDQNTCQYCRKAVPPAKLTIDHVLPRSRGGKDTWDNLVASCISCNHRKADRTPEEAGMELMRIPRPITIHSSRTMMRNMGAEDKLWRKYLYF